MEPITIPTYVDLELVQKSLLESQFEQQIAGTRLWKLPDDLERYKRIIAETEPEVVIECGTAWGGSALWFAGQGLRVVTIDTDSRRSAQARELAAEYGELVDITWVTGMSVGRAVRNRVHDLVKGERVMVSLDSDHSFQNVVREIRAYGPLVTSGCHLVVEDGVYELLGADWSRWGGQLYRTGGPLRAIQLLLQNSPEWIRDLDTEQLTSLSHSPAGWWRRV